MRAGPRGTGETGETAAAHGEGTGERRVPRA
jgi:hypothetical protein